MKFLALSLSFIFALNIFADSSNELPLPKGPGYAGDIRFMENVISVESYDVVIKDLLGFNEKFERVNQYYTEKAEATFNCKKLNGKFLFFKSYNDQSGCGFVILRNVKTETMFYSNLIIGPLSNNFVKSQILAQAIFAVLNGGNQSIVTTQFKLPLGSDVVGGLEQLSAKPDSFIPAGITVRNWNHLVTTDKNTLFDTVAEKENMKGNITYTVSNKSKRKKYDLETDFTLSAGKVNNSVQILNFHAGLK